MKSNGALAVKTIVIDCQQGAPYCGGYGRDHQHHMGGGRNFRDGDQAQKRRAFEEPSHKQEQGNYHVSVQDRLGAHRSGTDSHADRGLNSESN